jgi:hypothetical protein
MKQLQPVTAGAIPGSFFKQVNTFLTRLVDDVLNQVFSLTHRVSVIRWRALMLGWGLAWLVSILLVVPAAKWTQALQSLLGIVADPSSALNVLATIGFTVFFHPAVIRHLLALYVPFWLMHRVTAVYLADIFEREDQGVARKFIMQAAFGRGYSTIQISQGRVAEADQASVIIQIGGPGTVAVDLDSAALFEKPDGTSRVIRPTAGVVIDAFERIRRVIDLTDSLDLIDQVSTRSQDGINVRARDVQFSNSIYRGENPVRTLKTPYPFSQAAFETLVYRDIRVVQPDKPSTPQHEWQLDPFKMGSSVRAEIGKFISTRGLSQFLAEIGEPETTLLNSNEQEIERLSQRLSGLEGQQAGEPPLTAGKFDARPTLTSLFYKQDEFQNRLAQKGFQLNWIGVGTWQTPAEIIPANHREAWKISRDNLARGNPEALNALRAEAKLQELLRLIQRLPITTFYDKSEQEQSDDELVKAMLLEYENIFQRAAELYVRGPNDLDFRFAQLIRQARILFERSDRPNNPFYDNLLSDLKDRPGNYVFDENLQDFLRQIDENYMLLIEDLLPEDLAFVQDVKSLHEDIKAYNHLQDVIGALSRLRFEHNAL